MSALAVALILGLLIAAGVLSFALHEALERLKLAHADVEFWKRQEGRSDKHAEEMRLAAHQALDLAKAYANEAFENRHAARLSDECPACFVRRRTPRC